MHSLGGSSCPEGLTIRYISCDGCIFIPDSTRKLAIRTNARPGLPLCEPQTATPSARHRSFAI